MKERNEQIEKNFSRYPILEPTEEELELIYKIKDLAYVINATCPDGREKSLAMTKLEEAAMWANAAIARN